MSNANKTRSKKKIAIILSVLILAAGGLSYGIAFCVISFIKGGFKFKPSIDVCGDKATLIVTAVLFIVCIVCIFFVFFKYLFVGYNKMISKASKLDSSLYGSSEWQTQKEMDKNYKAIRWDEISATPDAEGFLISTRLDKGGNVIANRCQNAHALMLATTRVGKTKFWLSPSIQYLGRCPNRPSLFISDPKGELYDDNSALLKSLGYNIFVFNLNEPTKSHKYNPLGVVWDFYHIYKETGDTSYLDDCEALLREVAATIAPVEGNDPTWDVGAQNILQGICLAMLEDSDDPKYGMTKEKFTLWQVSNILSQNNDAFRDFALRRDKTSLARQRLMQYVSNSAKETMGSFILTTTNKLNQYVDTGMTYLMSGNELVLDEISDKPYAIFCIVPDDNKSRHPLAVLFASQIYKYLIHLAKVEAAKGNEQKLPNSFFFLLEEFGNFPKMECIEQMLSIGGGRRIWTCIVLQSLSQIRKTYGKEAADTILNNLQLQLYMGTTELETCKYYSEFFGSYTAKKNNLQLSSADLMKDVAGSTSAEKVMLILPDELMKLAQGEIVLKVFRHNPCRTFLLPIFDKELQKNRTFQIGGVRFNWVHKKIDKEKLYYDLTERDNHYDNIEDMPEPSDELEEQPYIEDVMNRQTQSTVAGEDIVMTYLKKVARGDEQ